MKKKDLQFEYKTREHMAMPEQITKPSTHK